MSWVLDNLGLIGSLTLVHVRQSIIPIVVGFVISVPLGWVAWRYRWLRGTLLTVTGLLYTIPSLALLMILPLVLGVPAFTDLNLIVALTIYAVALMVRAVADGLDSVDDDVRLAASAMGYGPGRRFWSVELPLAGPVILAGLRVTAASTIALATVGVLVGVTNLGFLFTDGLQRLIIPEVLAGILAVVVIAVVIDLALVWLGRALLPWNRSSRVTRAPRRARVALEAGAAS